MNIYYLRFVLKSDATFSRGDGVAGLVDAEVQHDDYGCPYLSGRTLKGLLVAGCAEILAALEITVQKSRWDIAARRLFGQPGSIQDDLAVLHIGNARLPTDLRDSIVQDVKDKRLNREQVLKSLTALRRQTAMDECGVPKKGSLRAMRVILRQTPFEATLFFDEKPTQDDLALLAACAKGFRRAGTGMNRGRGRLTAELLDSSRQQITQTCFDWFCKEVLF